MVVPIRMGYEFSYAKLEGAVKQALELGGTDRRDLCPPHVRGFKTHEVGLLSHATKCMPGAAIRSKSSLLGRHPFSVDLVYKMPDLGKNSGVISF
jgi:hypothetical protein